MRALVCAVLAAILVGCATDPAHLRAGSAEPAIAAATFCEVMAAQGGGFLWSKADTRPTKERADKLNAVWKTCPQYQGAPAAAPAK